MMTGLLNSKGYRISEKCVGKALRTVTPQYHARRMSSANCHINPVPYKANYPGEKLHIDQNEKLVIFGVTHICAVDGYSGMIMGIINMPVKNNIIIYEQLYMYVNNKPYLVNAILHRNIVRNYGLWDQIRVDHGKEWYLMLSVHQSLSVFRNDIVKKPFIQTSSKQVATMQV